MEQSVPKRRHIKFRLRVITQKKDGAGCSAPSSLYPVPILQEAGWAPGPVWTGGKSRPHRDSIPDLPARSKSLYRLSYPAHFHILLVLFYSSGSFFIFFWFYFATLYIWLYVLYCIYIVYMVVCFVDLCLIL